MSSKTPSEAPPSYAQATGNNASSASAASSSQPGPSTGRLAVPGGSASAQNGISPERRRSMEDEARPLPKGWLRTYDPETSHQFFVDTSKDPPRAIWHHPYDDQEYLSTLSTEERERIEEQSMRHSQPSKYDIMAEHTDEEDDDHHTSHAGAHDPELPPRPMKGRGNDQRTFGRKLKDKITGSSHEEREAERKRRAEEEQRLYESHLRVRAAMDKAAQTGERQLVGKDKNGKEVYVNPPQYGNGAGYGYEYGPSIGGGYAYSSPYSPYQSSYGRPIGPYGRPYGGGYGGGYGLPLAMGGGLLGGMLLGDMLFF